jgi:hypothetical protein
MAGRKPGAVGESTKAVRLLARKHSPKAFAELARLAQHAEGEAVRVAAIKEILDRAYGKSVQPIDGDGEGGPLKMTITWQADE